MRFGFAGLGTATHSLHLPALARIGEAEPVGGCDPAASQRQRFEQRTGLPAHRNLAGLIAAASPDVVVVASPPGSHVELCVEALRAGAHVLCEKPLAETVAGADTVIGEAERTGRALAVHHGFREQPIFRALRERISPGGAGAATPPGEGAAPREAPGRLLFCQVWQLLSLPPWEEPSEWRAARPDRALLEAGIHLVDLMLVLFGERPQAVYARRSAGAHEDARAEAVSLLTLEFSAGRLGQLTIDRLSRGGDRYAEVRADCERASLRASWGGRALLEAGKKRAGRAGVRLLLAPGGIAWEERGTRRRTLARDPRRPQLAGTERLLRGLIAAIRSGGEPPSSGREARATLEVVEAAYRSAESGDRVRLG